MNKTTYVQVPVIVHVPVYDCSGCAKRVSATPQTIEQNARFPKDAVPSLKIGAPPDALVATGFSPPEGWEYVNVPGNTADRDTDSYFCPECAPVAINTIQLALHAAFHAITVARNAGVSVVMLPPLQGTVIDERQAIIPHEFEPAADNLLDVCGICRALKPDCEARQMELTAPA